MDAADVSAADDEAAGVCGGYEGGGAASAAGSEVSGGLATSPSRATVTFLSLSLANSKALYIIGYFSSLLACSMSEAKLEIKQILK